MPSDHQPALAESSGATDVPLIEQTIGDNLDATAARWPEREALVDVAAGRRWTWAELVRDVDRLARGLVAAGVVAGDRVGIWAPNCAEWTLVQYATAKIGAILVTVNPAYRTHELKYVLEQAGIRMLVAAPSFRTSDYAAMIEQVRGEVPSPRAGRPHRPRQLGRPAGRRRPGDRRSGWPRSRPGCRPPTRSTSSTPPAPRASPRAPPSATATSSTTASSSASSAATPRPTGSASRCPSTTASAWSWATSRARRTARRWSSRRRVSTPPPRCRRRRTSTSPRSTACPRCSSPSGRCRRSATTTCRACAPGSWPGRPARPS